MFSRVGIVLLVMGSLLAGARAPAFAQDDAYAPLLDRYAGVSAVYVEAVSGRIELTGQAADVFDQWYAAELVAADRSGRFASRAYGGPTPPDLDGLPDAMEYLADDGTQFTLWAKSMYVETRLDRNLIGPPPSPHYALAPWPVLPVWVEALRAHEETELEHDGGLWVARNLELGLRIEWDDDELLRSARWSAPPPHHERAQIHWMFADLDARGLPRRAVQIQRIPESDGESVHESRVEYEVTVSTDPDLVEREIVFDPKAMGINRIDRATQNVYSPEGELLYNWREREKMLLRAEERRTGVGVARRIAIGVIVTAAGISIVIGWRRWVARGGR